ncbi:acyl-CoA dehydrogenase family protein [Streptomyces mutabilis]|uniref:acyl-CoA dehydrogenase family protein n=1 Tax=Streptomyces mutabilis TaxID=67332 RepID=UPI0036811604
MRPIRSAGRGRRRRSSPVPPRRSSCPDAPPVPAAVPLTACRAPWTSEPLSDSPVAQASHGALPALARRSRVDASVATFFGVHNGLAMYAIQAGGDQEQRDRWLPAIARMETVGAFALSEPLDGSDIVADMRTTARRDGDAWVIEGAKQFREAVGGRRCSKRSLPWLVCPVHPLLPLR